MTTAAHIEKLAKAKILRDDGDGVLEWRELREGHRELRRKVLEEAGFHVKHGKDISAMVATTEIGGTHYRPGISPDEKYSDAASGIRPEAAYATAVLSKDRASTPRWRAVIAAPWEWIASKCAPHKVAKLENLDVHMRVAFPLLYLLYVVVMLSSVHLWPTEAVEPIYVSERC